jgi:ATP-dependent Lhr-like helicase
VAFTELLPDPLGDLVARYARSHAPFTTGAVAHRYGLGVAVVTATLHRLAADGKVVEGEFLPDRTGPQWCEAGVLRMLRRRCLARLRQEVEPVPPQVLGAFLPAWQDALHEAVPVVGGSAAADSWAGVGTGAGTWRPRRRGRRAGPEAVYSVIEQLAGAAVPALALESLVLPARIEGYGPAMLDELTAAGDVVWAGAGALPGGDGWLVLAPADTAPLLLPPPGEITMTAVHEAVLDILDGGGALFFRALADKVVARVTAEQPGVPGTSGATRGPDAPDGSAARVRTLKQVSDQAIAAALWDLVWAGRLTNDTLAPLRTVLGTGRPTQPRTPPDGDAGDRDLLGSHQAAGHGLAGRPAARSMRHSSLGGRRPGFGRGALPSSAGPPTVSGRWSLVPPVDADETRRTHARALSLLDRHGIVIRGAATAERVPGGFGALYPVLRAMEEAGQCRRGYFVEGLGAAQFALPGAVDRMRGMADQVTRFAGEPGLRSGDGTRAMADQVTGFADGPGLRSDDVPLAPSLSASTELSVVVLAAADPANAYGAALPWPDRPDETPGGHRPGRKAGALVILVAGQLVLYVERGGKTLLSWTSDLALLGPATTALAGAVRAGALGRLTVERADGGTVYDSPLAQALEAAGFRPTPRGLRLRG